MWVHDDYVVQRVIDGHKAIISHHCQSIEFIQSKKIKKKFVSDIPHDSAVSLDVHNHLRNHGGGVTNVCQGQVGDEEVYGVVEVRVRGDSKDDEQVPKHSDQVHGQEEEGL